MTREYYEKFLVFPECGQIYWQGGHYVRIKLLIDEFAAERL
ncbi:Mut7-C RNAse domain-containing protein [Nitrosomonas sp.]|nr:Mut7-C RNAse domain-containing protein [Nitrosomonas sp.]